MRNPFSESAPAPIPRSSVRRSEDLRGGITHRPGAIAVLVFLAWMLPGLFGHDPWKPDEGYTFGLVNSILRTGDWIVPTLAGEPFMEKPPVFFLVAALLAKVASPALALHDGARLASAFFVGLAALFLGRASAVLAPARPVWVAPMLLIGNFGLVVHAHQLVTDNALLCGFAIAMCGFALALRKPLAGGFWLGTGVGLGFMAKGLLAPGVTGIAALLLPIVFAQWRTRQYATALAVAVVAAAPWLTAWPLALYLKSPQLFMEWFWTNNFGRFLGFAHLGPAAEEYAYLKLMLWFAFPSLPLAMFALWRGIRQVRNDAEIQIAVTLFAVTFAVLAIAADARELYGMPLLIPLALLGGAGLEHVPSSVMRFVHWGTVLLFTGLVLLVWACWFALDIGWPSQLADYLRQKQPLHAPHYRAWLLCVALALSAGWLTLIPHRPGLYRPALVWAGGLAAAWGLLGTLMLSWIDLGMSYRGMLSELVRALPAGHRCIASQSLGESQRGIFEYFEGIVTQRQEVAGARKDCDLLLVQTLKSSASPPGPSWTQIWDGARPGDNSEHFWLFQNRM